MFTRQKINGYRLGTKTMVVVMVTAMILAVFVGTVVAQNMSAEVFETNLQVSASGITPDIAVDSAGNIYVVWDHDAIYFAKSTDGGNTFGAAVQVSHILFGNSNPSITVDADDNVHIVWQQGMVPDIAIRYVKSTDYGTSFTAPVTVSDLLGENTRPDIASYGNNVYILWRNVGEEDNLFLDKSINGGTFGADVTVTGVDDRAIGKPVIAIGTGEIIYVAWVDALGLFRFNARIATSTNQGRSFGTSVKVSESEGVLQVAIAAIGTGTVYVTYNDMGVDPRGSIQFAKSTNRGAYFSLPVDVSDVYVLPITFGFGSSIAVHPCGKIFVGWRDDRSGQGKIYFASSSNKGVSFDGDVKVNDVAADHNDHREPSLAVGNDTQVYVVWRDLRAGTSQIYFAKAPDATWPSRIGDLAVVETTKSSVTLRWTAPGDNFALGTAASYDIRYATTPITDANWAAATQYIGEPSPQEGGIRETFEVTGLDNAVRYYFAIKTSDERNNTSPLSNVASKKELTESVVFQIDTAAYFVNNQAPGIEMGVVPFIRGGRTFVPMRFLANALGVNIGWVSPVATLSQPGFPVVKLTIGEESISIDGTITPIGIAPLLEDGRTMLPARFVAEALGYQATWLPEQRVVLVWPQGEPRPEIGTVLEYFQDR